MFGCHLWRMRFFGRIMTMARWRNSFFLFLPSQLLYPSDISSPYSSGSTLYVGCWQTGYVLVRHRHSFLFWRPALVCTGRPCSECAKWASISSTSLRSFRLRAVSSWSIELVKQLKHMHSVPSLRRLGLSQHHLQSSLLISFENYEQFSCLLNRLLQMWLQPSRARWGDSTGMNWQWESC